MKPWLRWSLILTLAWWLFAWTLAITLPPSSDARPPRPKLYVRVLFVTIPLWHLFLIRELLWDER